MNPLVVPRSRTVVRVWGRDPVKMIHGLATADIQAVSAERAAYTAFLTVKGRMVADARVMPMPGAAGASAGQSSGAAPDVSGGAAGSGASELLLTTDPGAAPGLLEHLRKFIPPLFARFEDVSSDWRVIGVYGDGASGLATMGLAAAGLEDTLSAEAADEAIGALSSEPPLVAIRSGETGGDGWEVVVRADLADAVTLAMVEAGGEKGTEADLEPLRIAAGRPRWGTELTGDVIPLEAGLERAISQTKGCYTGQEVIIRILHRGHVNRHLRGLEFSGDAPPAGTELFEEGNEKPRGTVTSVAGERGLGYVRREIEPPAELRAGSQTGPVVRVTALD